MLKTKHYKQIISLQKTIISLQTEKSALLQANSSLIRQKVFLMGLLEKGSEVMSESLEKKIIRNKRKLKKNKVNKSYRK